MYVLVGLIIGAIVAVLLPVTIPAAYSPYVAIALLGALAELIESGKGENG